jgi:hypothetical protein
MCGVDFECAPNEICEPGTGNCRESENSLSCTSDEICVTRLGAGSTCDLSSSPARCTEIALPGRCQTAADCLQNELCDIAIGACVAVQEPEECSATLPCDAGLVCTISSSGRGECRSTEVGCEDSTDCLASEECDPNSQQCVVLGEPTGCDSDADCQGSQFCDPAVGECRPVAGGAGCQTDLDCRGSEICDLETEECVARVEPVVECDGITRQCPELQVCLAGVCVTQAGGSACTTSEDCRANEVCDVTAGACVGTPNCENDDDCGEGFTCDVGTGLCTVRGGSCTANADCGTTEVCDFVEATCVDAGARCGSDVDCFGGQVCDSSTGTCQFAGDDCRFDYECCEPVEILSKESTTGGLTLAGAFNGTNRAVQVSRIARFQTLFAAATAGDPLRLAIYSSNGLVLKQPDAVVVSVVADAAPSTSGTITLASLDSAVEGKIVAGDIVIPANPVCELVCRSEIGFCSIPVSR